MGRRIRTFIAMAVTPEVRRRAVELQGKLGQSDANVKWVAEGNIHLTVKFLGDVDDIALPAVCRAVEQAVAETPRFVISVAGVGAFPSSHRPRTLWVGVREEAERVDRVKRALDEALFPLGFRDEERRFTPHLTIGRVKGGTSNASGLSERLAANTDWTGGRSEVGEVVVMSSELRSEGPLYTVMARAKLGG